MSSEPSFADTLRAFMHQPRFRLTPANLSNLSGVSKATIVNWLDGLTERPRRWQQVLQVADALRLNETAADQLLAAAGHQPVAVLHASATTAGEQALFVAWRSPVDAPIPPLGRTPNLVAPATTLIGRAHEQATLRGLLLRSDVRLVSLTGVGGTGKTLLALSVAAALHGAFADGIWHVSLAPLLEPRLVMPMIAQVLGISEAPGMPLVAQLAKALHPRQLLLVLDNFEHVLEAAPAIAELLQAAPRLKILATSRIVLHLYDEYEVPIPPLALPDMSMPATAGRIAQSPAVELFVRRASAVRAGFSLSDANAATIAAICARLDGLPLAIELATTHLAEYTPAQLLAHLMRGFDHLRWEQRRLPAHQQTLYTMLDWSYNLLDTPAQALFVRLAIFMGGWTTAAAEDICGDHEPMHAIKHVLYLPHQHPNTLDTLMVLADHSLIVRMEDAAGISRYTMLETIREYAAGRLRESGAFEHLKQRHMVYYLHNARQIEPELTGSNQVAALLWLEHEHANLRAALGWAIDQHHAEIACRLATALWRFWLIRGYLSEGRRWLESALAMRQALPVPVKAKALLAVGRLARQQADLYQAKAYLEAALVLERQRDDQHSIAFLLGSLGVVAYDQGHWTQAKLLHEQSLAIRHALDDQWGIAATLTNLGEVARQEGREAESQALHEQSLALFRTLHDSAGVAMALLNLGQIVGQRGDHRRATTLLHESLQLWQRLGEKVTIAECLEALAAIAVSQQQAVRAAQLGGAAAALRVAVGASLAPAERARYRQQLQAARAKLDKQRFSMAWQQGQAMSLEEAIATAFADSLAE